MTDYFRNLLDWILENKEWLFSGVGVLFVTVVFRFFRKKQTRSGSQQQQTKIKSRNLRAGGDINITTVLGEYHSDKETSSINAQREDRLGKGVVIDKTEEGHRNTTQRKAALVKALESVIQVTEKFYHDKLGKLFVKFPTVRLGGVEYRLKLYREAQEVLEEYRVAIFHDRETILNNADEETLAIYKSLESAIAYFVILFGSGGIEETSIELQKSFSIIAQRKGELRERLRAYQ